MSYPSAMTRVGLILRNEWTEALRSRRIWVVILLYVAVALLSMNGMLSLLLRLENELAELLGLQAGTQPGAVVDALWRSPRFRQMMANAMRSESIVLDLTGQSPVVLAYAGLAFFYTPLLVALVTPLRIAEDLASGTIRYIVTRTSLISWTLGKFLAQALLFALALLLSAAGAWLLTRYRMVGADPWALATGIFLWSARVWFYGLAFMGLVMGLAHWTSSPSKAMATSLLAVFGTSIAVWLFERYTGDGWQGLFALLQGILPQAYRMELWRSSWLYIWPAACTLCALGLTYLFAGYAVFRRRDL